jgi:hypothetical protein
MNPHRLTTRVAALAASAFAAATVAAGAGGATGPATTEPVQIYPFGITIQERAVKLQHHAIPFDSFTQFRIRNTTPHKRTFSIGGQTVAVRAKGGRILIIQFAARGKYPFTSKGPKGTRTLRGTIPVI